MVDFSSFLPTMPGIPYAYKLQLQSASFRGVPFSVEAAEIKCGRHTAVHVYPYSETDAYVEDLGLGTQIGVISGLLVGDFVILHHKALIKALGTAGPGDLVHPTLGKMKVSVVSYAAAEEAAAQRVVKFRMTFIQTRVAKGGAASDSPVKANATDAEAASSEARKASQQEAKAGVSA